MLIVSSVMRMIGNVIMIFSGNLFMVCMSIAFQAVSYNFASGSGDALAYDSLKEVGREEYYEKYASNQLVIYRLCSGISTMCAGFALLIGYRLAYSTDVLMCAVQIGVLLSLYEERRCHSGAESGRDAQKVSAVLGWKLVTCFMTSLSFLKSAKRAVLLMFCNSFVGAVDTLLLFFLQAKLPEAGMPSWALGFGLFFMEMGGIAGARAILCCERLRYRSVFAITAFFVVVGVLLEHSGMYIVMALGGFITAFCDDALQVRTNTILQESFPSEQRATLISIESFTFSIIMMVLSPLAGILFSCW